jgi:hypothetical protein
LQGDVGVELSRLAGEFGVQLILATHSVEMINRLGQQEGSTLLAVERGGPRPCVELRSQQEIIASLASFCDLTPFTSLSFLASRRILFHEGPSDLRVLEVCARLLFRSDPDKINRWKKFTPVSLNGVGNTSVRAILESVLTPQLFPDVKAAPVRAVLVRDRDWVREPRAASLATSGKHFESVDVVWSRHSIESLFLDKETLLAWLSALLSPTPANLAPLIETAIHQTNNEEPLKDAAEDGRALFHQRVDGQKKRLDQGEAYKRARQEVRAEPEVWQRGKDRASSILAKVRAALPARGANQVRADIPGLLEVTPLDALDPGKAIPGEISALLQAMVGP